MMVFDTKSVEVSDVKWPTTTTGIRGWKSWGGLPVLATCTTWGPWQMAKSEPAGGGVDGARDHRALQAERLRAERVPVGQGLVDRVEVVERAAQAFDEQEDEGDGQERRTRRGRAGSSGAVAAAAARPGPGGPRTSAGWAAGSARWSCRSRPLAAGRRALGLGGRRLRHLQRPLPAPAAQDQADGVDEHGAQRDGVAGVDVAHGASPSPGGAGPLDGTDELGVLAPALGQRDLELLVADRVLQHLDLVAHAEQPHEDQREGDEARGTSTT